MPKDENKKTPPELMKAFGEEAKDNAFEDMQDDEDLGTRYPIDTDTAVKLEKDFRTYNFAEPSADQKARLQLLRFKFHELAELIFGVTPPCREQSLAKTHLEDALMWANAAIARNER